MKKYFFVVIYRSPSQDQDEFDNFAINFELMLSKIYAENPFCIVITGDFNCRSTQWWEYDIENNEGKLFEPITSDMGLHQLIAEPTHLMGDSKSCIDLIFTDQPNLIIESGVHPSLHEQCHHQIVYGKLSVTNVAQPPYTRRIWHYNKADFVNIMKSIDMFNWQDHLNKIACPNEQCAPGLYSGPLFFLIYINDLTAGLKCNVKLFADDTSLFTIVQDSTTAASDMNHDLELIKQWANDWRMSFNPDPQKQAVELLFSRKRIEIDHPVVFFNDVPVEKVNEHKHLGIILDSKLSFSAHIKSAISKTRKGIGLLKYLSKYLPRHTLNELYKLYVRPHLDYGDVIYHIPAKICEFSQNTFLPDLMEKIESVQYSAALAITGTWKGTSRQKLHADLGWESLSSRRWSRRHTLFYKIINNLAPDACRAWLGITKFP